MTRVMMSNMIRLAIDAAALAAAFFVCRLAGLPLIPTLVAVTLSLTISGLLMVFILTRKAEKNDTDKKQS